MVFFVPLEGFPYACIRITPAPLSVLRNFKMRHFLSKFLDTMYAKTMKESLACEYLGGSAERHNVKEGKYPEEELLGQHLVNRGRVVREVGEHLRGGAHKISFPKPKIPNNQGP